MLPVENNFNKNGLPHVYIALFRCLWVPGGGLEPFRRVLRFTLKKMVEKSSQFLSSEQPCEPKSLEVALKITGVEEIPSEVNLEPI